jgi:beta-N-acetylhexosaminidase
LSEKIITDDLRGTLGFDGVVLTGPLNQGAITSNYSSDQAAVAAIKAGADMLYMPEDFEAAYQGLLNAVQNGEISEDRINESLTRIFRIKYAETVDQITEN